MVKRKAPSSVKAEATAKAEVVAKATYQSILRRRSFPPDVTRVKAGAWLDLISPITEWVDLKGDALNFQRRLLRVQQEETLLRVAQSVQAKMAEATISQPVPRKILVPALEKASLEEPNDSAMIDRWASLLASAAQTVRVQPRFVGILEEMTGQQAECLERLAFNRYKDFYFPSTIFGDSFLEFAEYNMREVFKFEIRKVLTDESAVDVTFERIQSAFNRPGVALETALIGNSEGELWERCDSIVRTGLREDTDLSILESLGLIRFVVLKEDILLKRKALKCEVSAYYHYLTKFGVEFCEVVSRSRLNELEIINLASAEKGIERQNTF
jgi:hypothetical protein